MHIVDNRHAKAQGSERLKGSITVSSKLIKVYAFEKCPQKSTKSLFLAGPTPRDDKTESWRPEALAILEELGYDGVVYIPEDRDGQWKEDYDGQVIWEDEALRRSDRIVFWVPRELKRMPGFTTNVEFGLWLKAGWILLGAPPNAPKMRYLQTIAGWEKVPTFDSLKETLMKALEEIGEGATRIGAECDIPLDIWKTKHFRAWYAELLGAGNSLVSARLAWHYRPGKRRNVVFWIALHPVVHIAKENRNKANEIVLMRTDISAVVLYGNHGLDPEDIDLVTVKEFRSTVRNAEGYVWELPSGSSRSDQAPEETASDEVFEETGLRIAPDRFNRHGSRQVAATVSSHKAFLYSCELTKEEIAELRTREGVAQGDFIEGDAEKSERTFVKVIKLSEVWEGKIPFDYGNLGMILQVLHSQLMG